MIVNVAAFVFVVGLIGAGFGWPIPWRDAQEPGLRAFGTPRLYAGRSDQRPLVSPGDKGSRVLEIRADGQISR